VKSYLYNGTWDDGEFIYKKRWKLGRKLAMEIDIKV
jgi:hypothetical protein